MEKENTHRYQELADKLGLNINQLSEKTGIHVSTIRKAIDRDSAISAESALKIMKTFPGLNYAWLRLGVGEMYADYSSEVGENGEEYSVKVGQDKEVIMLEKQVGRKRMEKDLKSAFEEWQGLPMYNNPITASFIETYRDDTSYQPQYYLHDPRFKDCDFGAIITGDSMHSEIRHGDFVACKEVTDRRFIVFGDIYYVVANNGLETCKYLNVDPDNKNNFLLVAKSERISPSPLPKDMILRLYKVRGIVRGY